MRFTKSLSIISFVALSISANAAGTAEDFAYAAGNLTTASGSPWTAHSSGGTNPVAVVAGSLAYTGLTQTGEKATFTISGEDVSRAVLATTPAVSTTVYYSAVISIANAGTTGDYFMHLTDGAQTSGNFRARLFARSAGAGVINLGLRYGSGDTIQFTTAQYNLNTPIFIVVKVESVAGTTNDTASLFVNPAFGGTEPAPTITTTQSDTGQDWTNLGFIAIRQGSNSAANSVSGAVDSIRFGRSWADVTNSDASIVPVTVSGFTIE